MPNTITDLTFTRGTGATRFNEFGNLVGVDFSTTSLTIGTGPQTFTLLATGDRDWSPGQGVIAVAQAGATGSMTGTVTSYNPTTQALVINVASITGSGTGTDWRIGSLDLRRTFDPVTGRSLGFLSEAQRTNRITNNTFRGAVVGTPGTLPTNMIVPSSVVSRSVVAVGMINGISYIDIRISGIPASATVQTITFDTITASIGETWTTSGWFALIAGSFANISSDQFQLRASNESGNTQFLPTATLTRVTNTRTLTGTSATWTLRYRFADTVTPVDFTIRIGLPQSELGSSVTSPIPTSSLAITRAADSAMLSGSNFSQAYNASAGALVLECTTPSTLAQAVPASINDGTTNNALRVSQRTPGTSGSIRKMISDGITDVLAINDAINNTLRSNGLDYIEGTTGSGLGSLSVATSTAGGFLQAGSGGTIRMSSNSGQTYTPVAPEGTLHGSHGALGKLVIVGEATATSAVQKGFVLVSDDGILLRRVSIPNALNGLRDVCSNGSNLYVAVGIGGSIYTSPDAETWTQQTSPTIQTLESITYGAGLFVATIGNGANRFVTSPDGITWTLRAAPGGQQLRGVYFGNSLFVAVGDAGLILTSPDGINWTVQTSNIATSLRAVTLANTVWVAVGVSGGVVTSPDATAWTNRTATSGTTVTLNAVSFFGNAVYYAGASQTVAAISRPQLLADGAWNQRTITATSTLNSITPLASRLCITGSQTTLLTADDGVSYTARTGNGVAVNGATFGNGTYVVVGGAANGSAYIATVNPSTGAVQRRVSGITGSLTDVRFTAGAFYATGTAQILRSVNGIDWTNLTVGGTSATYNRLAFNGASQYVAVGSSGRFTVSADGIAFANSALTGATTQTLQSISFANGLYVACGNAGVIITSPDGTTWTARVSGTTQILYSVMYSDRDAMWYVSGDAGTVLRSVDGIAWSPINNDAMVGVLTSGVATARNIAGKFVPGARNRIAVAWGGGIRFSINGGATITDAASVMPIVSQLSLGASGDLSNPINGTIKLSRLFNNALTNEELQALSRI